MHVEQSLGYLGCYQGSFRFWNTLPIYVLLKIAVLDEFHRNAPVCFIFKPPKDLYEMLLILYRFMLDLAGR